MLAGVTTSSNARPGALWADITQKMALASFDFFGIVEAAHTGHGSGFDALTVETTGRWMLVPLHLHSHQRAQQMMDALPVSQAAPAPEVIVNRLPGRKPGALWARQQTPLHTCHRHKPQRVQNRVLVARRAPDWFFGQQRFDNLVLCLGEIRRVSWFFHTSQFTPSPRHFQNSF